MAGPQQDLRTRLPRLDASLLLHLAVCFALCTAVWYLARGVYLQSVVYAGSPILRLFIDTGGLELIKMEGDTIRVNSGLRSEGEGSVVVVELVGMLHRDWSLLILGLAVCLTSVRRVMHGWYWVAGAFAFVWLSQVVTLCLLVLEPVAQLHAEAGRALVGESVRSAMGLMEEYLTAARPFIPLLAMLPVWLARVPEAPRGRRD